MCGWREGDGASRAAGALSLSDVSLLSEDPCVFASRSCFASTSVFPNDFCSSPVSNERKTESDSHSMKVK